MADITRHWQRITWLSLLLWPLSLLYCFLVLVRRGLYRLGLLSQRRLPVPVIIVGNITVGGTGKTPLVIWLVQTLQQQGYRPGVIVRGYRGTATQWPQRVTAEADPVLLGDEAVLLAQKCSCPVVAGPDRVAAAHLLLQQDCNVVISDDGLQHYALARAIEIAVVDGSRRQGNGFCLPAGPLREPVSRLRQVDLVITNGLPQQHEHSMTIKAGKPRKLAGGNDELAPQPVHAVAGIGNPERFFSQLETLGMSPTRHAFDDHHRFIESDVRFDDNIPVIMTEKDAVKCRAWAEANTWVLPIEAEPDVTFAERITALLQEKSIG